MIQTVSSEAESYLDGVQSRLIAEGVRVVETQVAQGSPADAIVSLATAEPGSLVAMTTHGRSGLGRMVLGSVAERVVRQSGCPVLLIRGEN